MRCSTVLVAVNVLCMPTSVCMCVMCEGLFHSIIWGGCALSTLPTSWHHQANATPTSFSIFLCLVRRSALTSDGRGVLVDLYHVGLFQQPGGRWKKTKCGQKQVETDQIVARIRGTRSFLGQERVKYVVEQSHKANLGVFASCISGRPEMAEK